MNEQQKAALAIIVGVVTFLCGGIVIHNDPHSVLHWIGGLALILGGVLLEEKYLLKRR